MTRDEIIEAGAKAEYERLLDGNAYMVLWSELTEDNREHYRKRPARLYDAMAPLIRQQAIADNDTEWCSIAGLAGVRPDGEEFTPAVLAAIRAAERRKVAEEIARVAEGWASNTIDLRAAPAYEAMAEVARIIGRKGGTS